LIASDALFLFFCINAIKYRRDKLKHLYATNAVMGLTIDTSHTLERVAIPTFLVTQAWSPAVRRGDTHGSPSIQQYVYIRWLDVPLAFQHLGGRGASI